MDNKPIIIFSLDRSRSHYCPTKGIACKLLQDAANAKVAVMSLVIDDGCGGTTAAGIGVEIPDVDPEVDFWDWFDENY